MPRAAQESRKDVRVDVNCPVTICTGGLKRRARVLDLSCGGARIGYENSHIPVPAGAHRLRIEPVGADALELVAMPVWRSRFSYGAKFLLADDMERLAIAETIDACRGTAENKATERRDRRESGVSLVPGKAAVA